MAADRPSLADILGSANRCLAELHNRPVLGMSHDHHVMMVLEFVRDLLTLEPSRFARVVVGTSGGAPSVALRIAGNLPLTPHGAQCVAVDLLRAAEEAER